MRWNDTAKVGAAVLAAFLLLAVATFSLRGTFRHRGSYLQKVAFENAQGIQEGALVRVRGVDLGSVEDITLDPSGYAILTLRMSNRYRIQPADEIRIAGGLIGFTAPFVEVTPGARQDLSSAEVAPGVLRGETGTTQDQLAERGEELLTNVNELAKQMNDLTRGLNRMVQDPEVQRSLKQTAVNLERVSQSGVVIARNTENATMRANGLIDGLDATMAELRRTLRQTEQVIAGFQGASTETEALLRDTRGLVEDTRGVVRDTGETLRNANTVVQNAGALVTETRSAVGENRGELRELVTNLNRAAQRLDETLEASRSLIADPGIQNDLRATAENTRKATEGLAKITEDIRVITGDPEVQQDLKETVSRLKDVTTEASDVLNRVRQVVGSGGKTAKSIGERLSDASVRSDITRGTRSNRTRVDFDATIPWSDETFYRLGFFDFGERNRFNLQAGQMVRPGVWTRYGIHASKIALGLDLGNPTRPPLVFDLYGVDNPRADLRGYIPLGSYFDFTIGVDNLTRRADPVFGVRYRR